MSLDMLPGEVLEQICTYLETADIIKLRSIVRRMHEISYRNVFRIVRLRNEWYIKPKLFSSFFRKKFSEVVTVFDITSIYWIPAAEIRHCISAMVNLVSLFAMDTKLGLSEPDLLAYKNLPKLKKLSVTSSVTNVEDSFVCNPKNYPPVSHLYLQVTSFTDIKVLRIILAMKTCEELWLIEPSRLLPVNLPPDGVKRFFISSKYVSSVEFGKPKIFSSCLINNQFYIDKAYPDSMTLQTLPGLDEPWQRLIQLRQNSSPFNFVQTKQVFDGRQINTMKFEEINLMHANIKCGDQHENLVVTLMVTDNMKYLKKLALNYCCCLPRPSKSKRNVSIFDPDQDRESKRLKVDDVEPSLLARIVDNSPLIEELELWSCQRVCATAKLLDISLEPIAKLKNLKRLLLDYIPLTVKGSFLTKICCECKHLQSLSIRSVENPLFHIAVCNVLQSISTIKDFRYEAPSITYRRLFESLTTNEQLKLRRLHINTKFLLELCDTTSNIIIQFVSNNPQIRLFVIICDDIPATKAKALTSSLAKFKESGLRVLQVSNQKVSHYWNVWPLIHLAEIIRHDTKVSVIDIRTGYKHSP